MNDSENTLRLSRILLWITLVALGACAAIGIVVLLFGSFGALEWRILGTCAATAYCSLTGLGCAVALERALLRLLAQIGIVASCLAYAALTLGIWSDFFSSDEFGKATVTVSLFAGALAHTSLMSLARLRQGFVWARVLTVVAAFLLATLLSGALIFEETDDDAMRLIGVVTILLSLGTLAVPVLHRLSQLPPREGYPTERPEEIEVICPRCQKRQRILIGRGHCSACELEIRVEVG